MGNKKNSEKRVSKRNRGFKGTAPWEKVSVERQAEPGNAVPGPVQDSTLDKITASSGQIDQINSIDHSLDLVSITAISEMIKANTRCARCNRLGSLEMRSTPEAGLARNFVLRCNGCGDLEKTSNSTMAVYSPGGKSDFFESINLALVNAARLAGIGKEATKRFCAFLNLRQPPAKWSVHQEVLREAYKTRAEESMSQAIEEVKLHAQEQGLEAGAMMDGSWMKRGRTSLVGFVSAIGLYNNKVIGIDVRHKYCQSCKGQATEDSPCKLGENCGINHTGSSGAMEPEGAVNIIKKLKDENDLQITQYLGDGDCKAFAAVEKTFPEWKVKKLECINHLSKRMGTRLLNRKKEVKGLGGRKGSLTDAACKKIQSFYHWIIVSSDGDVSRMRKRMDAMFRHISSSDKMPDHELCEEQFCKYAAEKKQIEAQLEAQIEKPKGRRKKKGPGGKKRKMEPPQIKYRHSDHFHIPMDEMKQVKDIFVDLAKPELLEKVTHGKTQNSNESFNSTVWNLLPKSGFANRPLVEWAVSMAICQFNEGRRPILDVLARLGFPIGSDLKKYCQNTDKLRVAKRNRKKANPRPRKQKLKVAAATKATAKDYAPGGF